MKKSVWQWMALSGVLSAVVYWAHVILGGILWPEYNHVTQTISELTADGAPNAGLLRILTTVYGLLAMLFAVSLFFFARERKMRKTVKTGAALLIVMEAVSFFGYMIFPLNGGTMMQNSGHLVVTAVVVLCTIACGFLIGIGFKKTEGFKKTGVFILVCAVIMVISGGFSPVAMANGLPFGGIVERINIFALQLWIAVLSVRLRLAKVQE